MKGSESTLHLSLFSSSYHCYRCVCRCYKVVDVSLLTRQEAPRRAGQDLSCPPLHPKFGTGIGTFFTNIAFE